MPGIFLEIGGNGLDRRGEVGRNRNLHFICVGVGSAGHGQRQGGKLEDGAQRDRSHETAPE
ncbi:hypothetical protein [Pseudomonas syringae]|uniref:hypothetical protein n=1 Tax=Pseudomonas syringae TaxID=317 RepID=UPI00301CC234